MTAPALLDALDRLRDTGPEFQGFLANHGPMAAEAMTQFDLDVDIPGWVDAYRKVLGPAPETSGVVTAQTWDQHLGDIRLLGDWIAVFRRELAEAPWRTVLATWWPRLLPGLVASATHGLIRTAHGVRQLATAGDRPEPALVDELAHGLGYWAARYQPLPGDPKLTGPSTALRAMTDLPRLPVDVPSAGPGIVGRLVSLVRLPELPAALDAWGVDAPADAAMDELIAGAARVLAARDDAPVAFCHTVTAPAAVRLVLPSLPVELHRPTVAATWQAVGSVVSGFASPRLAAEALPVDVDPAPLLERLAGRAVEHGDEHVIKLTEAVLREYPRTHDTTLLVAADRYRGRIDPN